MALNILEELLYVEQSDLLIIGDYLSFHSNFWLFLLFCSIQPLQRDWTEFMEKKVCCICI